MNRAADILLVDDNPADIDLTSEALAGSKHRPRVSAVHDAEEAMLFLRRRGKYSQAPAPDLVVLDLNLPRRDGRELLSEIKNDPQLGNIPVVIFTTSQADSDISRSYQLRANCYLRKPGNLAEFVAMIESMAEFWLGYASLPDKEKK